MEKQFKGLSLKHRLAHILGFEILALLLITPLASWILNEHFTEMLSLAITGSLIASCWNFIFNYIFDAIENYLGKDRTKRGLSCRIFHSLIFQGSLMLIMTPIIAMFLGFSLIAAFMIEVGFIVFFMIYTGFYNYLFDFVLFNIFKVHLKIA